MTLVDFLLLRIAEDYSPARARVECEWSGVDAWGDGSDIFYGDQAPASAARVLAECEAKRRLVELHPTYVYTDTQPGFTLELNDHPCEGPAPCRTLRVLAAVYADHPDYREEWRA